MLDCNKGRISCYQVSLIKPSQTRGMQTPAPANFLNLCYNKQDLTHGNSLCRQKKAHVLSCWAGRRQEQVQFLWIRTITAPWFAQPCYRDSLKEQLPERRLERGGCWSLLASNKRRDKEERLKLCQGRLRLDVGPPAPTHLAQDLGAGRPAQPLRQPVEEPEPGEGGNAGAAGEQHVDQPHHEQPRREQPAGARPVRHDAADELADGVGGGLAAGDETCGAGTRSVPPGNGGGAPGRGDRHSPRSSFPSGTSAMTAGMTNEKVLRLK